MDWERNGSGGPAGLQNRDGGAIRDSGGFDSHTFPPAWRCVAASALALSALGLCFPVTMSAQEDTTLVTPSVIIIEGPSDVTQPPPAEQDTILFPRAPAKPLVAFFRSLIVPGWSQALLGRRLTAGLFLAVEGISLGMYLKAARELKYLEATESPGLDGKQQERQDWLILLGFNHLFAGLEAFVSSHLWDFPDDVRLRAAPEGLGIRLSMPIRLP